jgi:hypothetical protein
MSNFMQLNCDFASHWFLLTTAESTATKSPNREALRSLFLNGIAESGHLLTLFPKDTERGEFAINAALAYRYAAKDGFASRD